MFEALSDKFTNVFKELRGYGRLSEKNIETALRQVRLALLEADVHVGVVRSFLENVKQRALGQAVLDSLKPNEQFLKIVHEELVRVLGEKPQELSFEGKPPHVILLAGLQGCGKTTSAAKLAKLYQSKGRRPYLIPADVYRPAAIDQLQTLAKKLDVPCYSTRPNDKPVKIVKKGVSEAKDHYCDLVIVDTAGRLHIDEELMSELKKIQKKLDDPKVLFVADAMTGQEAVKVAKAFHDLLSIDGVILTKLDGDARGGAALSVQSVAGCPIYFTGVGEKIEDFEAFDAERLVSRLLDRGDLMALVEKAQGAISEDDAKELTKKITKNAFSIEDFRTHLRQMKKMGSMKGLMSMLPGGKSMTSKVDFDHVESDLKKKEAIIDSMTKQERVKPEILNGSRRLRIAKGSGTQVADVNRFLKEFAQMKKMMKQFSRGGFGGLKNLLKKAM